MSVRWSRVPLPNRARERRDRRHRDPSADRTYRTWRLINRLVVLGQDDEEIVRRGVREIRGRRW